MEDATTLLPTVRSALAAAQLASNPEDVARAVGGRCGNCGVRATAYLENQWLNDEN